MLQSLFVRDGTKSRHWLRAAFALYLGALLTTVSAPQSAWAQLPWSGMFGEEHPVGSAQWWKKYKNKAVFTPGKGYTVEGFDGYFDGMGRPLDRPVTADSAPHPDLTEDTEKGLAPALDPRNV